MFSLSESWLRYFNIFWNGIFHSSVSWKSFKNAKENTRNPKISGVFLGAAGRIWTADLILTKRFLPVFITIFACFQSFSFRTTSFPELSWSAVSVVSTPVCGGTVVKQRFVQTMSAQISSVPHSGEHLPFRVISHLHSVRFFFLLATGTTDPAIASRTQ